MPSIADSVPLCRWVAIRRHEYELLDERHRCRPQPQWRGLQPPQRSQYGREHARPKRVYGHPHRQLCRPVTVPKSTDTADAEWGHAKRLPILQQPRLSNESCSPIKTAAPEGRQPGDVAASGSRDGARVAVANATTKLSWLQRKSWGGRPTCASANSLCTSPT